jgi:hypothetical protein
VIGNTRKTSHLQYKEMNYEDWHVLWDVSFSSDSQCRGEIFSISLTFFCTLCWMLSTPITAISRNGSRGLILCLSGPSHILITYSLILYI